ncbi:hypothetical protein F1C58_16620 (plasmid) [Glaciihabitans sp. INWT7]|uniref:hypothetical protein n=1 Tax=Glaciihabitans sp. INWT7 TaxID=2596912 RepID=UPI001623A41D|nr:hypothetical protein [Glaciihabitans sp. INWT7]QNE48681.1 hypothetical protein F1C58_16620 [Glaciihabitans sp. INWT7]
MTFTEADHPRTAGKFTDKLQTPPEAQLSQDAVAGYIYLNRVFTGPQLVATMIKRGELSPAAADMDVEDVLNQHAGANAIERDDERTFADDEFPKVLREGNVLISDHPSLGREYWNFPGYDEDPLTGDGALDEFAQTLDGVYTDELWEGTDYSLPAEHNLTVIKANAVNLGIDFTALGYPLPTRHN